MLVEPIIEVSEEIVYASIGEMVELACLVVSNPGADMLFYKNEMIFPINRTEAVKESPVWLYVAHVTINSEADFGEYKCEGSNKIGTTTQIINLKEKCITHRLFQIECFLSLFRILYSFNLDRLQS